MLQSKIRCAEAVAQINDKRYKQAARKLVDVRPVLATCMCKHRLQLAAACLLASSTVGLATRRQWRRSMTSATSRPRASSLTCALCSFYDPWAAMLLPQTSDASCN